MHLNFPFSFLDVGTPEFVLILFVALLLFGGKKLPELAKGLGKAMREFKDATSGVEAEIKRAINESGPEPRNPAAVSSAEPATSKLAATPQTTSEPKPNAPIVSSP